MIDEIVNNLQRIADRKCYPEDALDGSIAQEWVDYIVDLQQRIDKTIELTKNLLKTEDRGYYQILFKEILKSLGDEESDKN